MKTKKILYKKKNEERTFSNWLSMPNLDAPVLYHLVPQTKRGEKKIEETSTLKDWPIQHWNKPAGIPGNLQRSKIF